jgi:hypothetical protein
MVGSRLNAQGRIMKTRTKKYRKRDVIANPLEFMVKGLQRIDPEKLTDLGCKNHAALLNITSGRGDRFDWDKLVGAINMAIVMAETLFDGQYKAKLVNGQGALFSVGKRSLLKDRFGFSGDELTAINAALAVHDAQLEASRVIDVERAYDEVLRRLRSNINVTRIRDKKADVQLTEGA